MAHPILFGFMCFFTFASSIGMVADANGTKRFNNMIDTIIYGYTAYVLWGI